MTLKKRFDIGRAGKVKSQTPRVECCMGKERQARLLKNGRAKKRRLFNKRFGDNVTNNAVTTNNLI